MGKLKRKAKDSKMRNWHLQDEHLRAKTITKKLIDNNGFSLNRFKVEWMQLPKTEGEVLVYFQKYIERLVKQERNSTANSYNNSLNFIKGFFNHKHPHFDEITHLTISDLVAYAKKYQSPIRGKLSINTINIYLRSFRAVYNDYYRTIGKSPDANVWSRSSLGSVRSPRKALKPEELRKLYHSTYTPTTQKWMAQQFFLFSYFCSGINLVDMQNLRWSDIVDQRIHWVRSKTSRSVHSVKINNDMKYLLNYFEQFKKKDSDPIFQVLHEHSSLEMTRYQSRKISKANMLLSIRNRFRQTVNKSLKKIAQDIGINSTNFSLYSARHTFASVLDAKGEDRRIIQTKLGHSALTVTENYLDSLSQERMDEADKSLEIE